MSYTHDATPTSPTPRATRSDGWTTERQLDFLEELAAHGNVEQAAAAADMSASSAYRLRARDAEGAFAVGWRAASAMAYYAIRELAIARVTRGVTVPVMYRGEIVGTRAIFSDRLLKELLKHLQPVAGAPAANGARRPVPDPAIAYAATVDAYTGALETGDEPVAPRVDDGTGPDHGPTQAELTAVLMRDERRADRWLDVVGEELTGADLDDAASMADLDEDIRTSCAADCWERGGRTTGGGRSEKAPAFV
ncbi:hypothetical protein KZX46_19045 [Polymorphobacter sp. PAMC 29334]|uniref:hypothetical protein n=1 Tax=Polymorphobacter sp. PAMC 29334 TaxID=2862331 RepID=UPI001C78FABB|nr:hypothetical protein [Polymorphobacter sp. PAMC 29334]QYE34810.1 hypothetical protein KZX46_19045 [Polymorphobacter sp. PAMC 29334]